MQFPDMAGLIPRHIAYQKVDPVLMYLLVDFFVFSCLYNLKKYYIILIGRASLLLFKLSKQSHCKVQQK